MWLLQPLQPQVLNSWLRDHSVGQTQGSSLHTRPPCHRSYDLIIPRTTSALLKAGRVARGAQHCQPATPLSKLQPGLPCPSVPPVQYLLPPPPPCRLPTSLEPGSLCSQEHFPCGRHWVLRLNRRGITQGWGCEGTESTMAGRGLGFPKWGMGLHAGGAMHRGWGSENLFCSQRYPQGQLECLAHSRRSVFLFFFS